MASLDGLPRRVSLNAHHELTPITNCRRPLGWLQEGAGWDRRRSRNDATLGVGRWRQRREDALGPADNRNLVDNPGVGQPRSVERGAGP